MFACYHFFSTSTLHPQGVDKVREWEPGNDKDSWGNDHIGASEIYEKEGKREEEKKEKRGERVKGEEERDTKWGSGGRWGEETQGPEKMFISWEPGLENLISL